MFFFDVLLEMFLQRGGPVISPSCLCSLLAEPSGGLAQLPSTPPAGQFTFLIIDVYLGFWTRLIKTRLTPADATCTPVFEALPQECALNA